MQDLNAIVRQQGFRDAAQMQAFYGHRSRSLQQPAPRMGPVVQQQMPIRPAQGQPMFLGHPTVPILNRISDVLGAALGRR
jgi:hypothetical protein